MASETFQTLESLTADAQVYLTAATTTSILESCENSGLFNDRDAALQFVALAIIASFTNKRATSEQIQKEKFTKLRPYISRGFMINNSPNNNAISQAGLCFLTLSAVQKLTVSKKFKEKYGKTHPWEAGRFNERVSGEQAKILDDKISRFTEEEAKKFAKDYFLKAGLSGGSTIGNEKSKKDEK